MIPHRTDWHRERSHATHATCVENTPIAIYLLLRAHGLISRRAGDFWKSSVNASALGYSGNPPGHDSCSSELTLHHGLWQSPSPLHSERWSEILFVCVFVMIFTKIRPRQINFVHPLPFFYHSPLELALIVVLTPQETTEYCPQGCSHWLMWHLFENGARRHLFRHEYSRNVWPVCCIACERTFAPGVNPP